MALVEKTTQEDLVFYEIMRNPVLACEFIYNFDRRKDDPEFIFTYYQSEMLCDFNPFQVECTARAVGKCLQKDSLISDPISGEYRTVEDWYKRGSLHKIISINQDTWKQTINTPFITPNGIKDCIQIDTVKGFKTIVTEEHPILTNKGFIDANKLQIGDYVAIAKDIPYFGFDYMDKPKILAASHFIAEGTFHCGSITTTESEVILDLEEIANYFECTIRKDKITYFISSKNNNGHGDGSGIVGVENKYLDFLSELGLREKHSTNKFIPQQIFRLNKKDLALFLNRLFSDDGWCIVGERNNEVGYCSSSEKLARDLQHLLLRFGIVTTLNYKDNGFSGAWTITIKGRDINKFKNEIGFVTKRKQENLEKICAKNNTSFNQADILPIPNYNKYRILKGKEKWSSKLNYYPTREKSKRVTNKDSEFNRFENSDIFWARIKNLTSVKNQETYAIEVQDNHTHLVDNIWSHNTVSLSSLIVWMLIYKLFPENYLLFATPSKVHLQPVWDNLVRQFRSNSFLKYFIPVNSGINASDYSIKLLNQMMLTCRIAGQTGTGSNLIGLHTPIVLVEEAGYFPWAAFQEMQPDLNTFVQGYREVVAGVPTGLRENNVLFHCDQENSSYTKHRVSAFENPRFTELDQQHALEQYGGENSEDYVHFVLGKHGKPVYALFDRGSMEIGNYPVYKLTINGQVFQDNMNEYVSRIATFPGLANKSHSCIMGVDLGYTEPTAIWILDLDDYGRIKFHGKIRLDKVAYPIQERLIDLLDSKFDPVLIGVDKGAGGQGISLVQHLTDDKDYLHKNYNKKLTPVDFSTTMSLGYNTSGEELKSRTKPFAISILQDYVNNHKIIFSSTDIEMVSELERMTYTKNPTGDIVYRTLTPKGGKRGEDHFTQSLLCASLAYYMANDYILSASQRKKLIQPVWII